MGQIIHPNQFPTIQNTFEEEESTDGMTAALRFLEGIDYDENTLRRRRRQRAERTVTATVSSMASRATFGGR